MYEAGDKLHMTVPYLLNTTFRTIFKTAPWLREKKVFAAANTPQNKRKWATFRVHAQEALAALAALDNEELSTRGEERLAADCRRTVADIRTRIEEAIVARNAAVLERNRALKQAEAMRPQLQESEDALCKLLEERREAEAIRNEVIAPALKIYEEYGLTRIIRNIERGAAGYRAKPIFVNAQSELVALVRALRRIGYDNGALFELSEMSANRPDKVPVLLEMARTRQFSGLTPFPKAQRA